MMYFNLSDGVMAVKYVLNPFSLMVVCRVCSSRTASSCLQNYEICCTFANLLVGGLSFLLFAGDNFYHGSVAQLDRATAF